MRAVAWVAVWVVLVGASAWYLWRCLRQLFRTTGRLANELAEAQRRLSRVQEETRARHTEARARQTPGADEPVQLAVFTGITQAAQERRAVREALLQVRRARREANRPGWARRVDSDST